MEQENIASKRIELWLKYKGLNANSAAQLLGYTNASKMYKILQGTSPGFDTIVEFLRAWPELSADWLLLGEGPMTRPHAKEAYVETSLLPTRKSTQILTITVGLDGRENIELVPVPAQAGYIRQFNEAVFLEQLRQYRIPGFEHGTFRAFEVQGDSMEPTINHADIVIGSFVEEWRLLEPGAIYVVVTRESVMLKRITERITDPDAEIMLHSDNPSVPDYPLDVADIQQLWRVQGYVSRYIPSQPDYTVERLWEVIDLLKLDQTIIKQHLEEQATKHATPM